MKHELSCDRLAEDPSLDAAPDPAPAPAPPPPRRRVCRKKLVFPPRFALITVQQWNTWVNHRKEVYKMKHFVDDHPPALYPELYLKPRRLDLFARQLEANMLVNRDLLKKINLIQRTGGKVDCWNPCTPYGTIRNRLLCEARQRKLDKVFKQNCALYGRFINARSDMLLTKEMDLEWIETKKKLILGASLPFILFKTETIDRGMRDPMFEKPPGVQRDRVMLEVVVDKGAKVGKLFAELFNDVVPATCDLFLSLLRGDASGHAYRGTAIFRIVPGLYCRLGDVEMNNGFGEYVPEGQDDGMPPENYALSHSVPGVLSMAVNGDGEVTGQFNIIFKPLPQLDGSNVVFGRIVSGPAEALVRISALGLPLGAPTDLVLLSSCGIFRKGRLVEGERNTVRFPPSRFTK